MAYRRTAGAGLWITIANQKLNRFSRLPRIDRCGIHTRKLSNSRLSAHPLLEAALRQVKRLYHPPQDIRCLSNSPWRITPQPEKLSIPGYKYSCRKCAQFELAFTKSYRVDIGLSLSSGTEYAQPLLPTIRVFAGCDILFKPPRHLAVTKNRGTGGNRENGGF